MDEQRSKRQQILDAAYEVFSRKGYYRATVDEIISLADTGKGTVYNYFNNKEQLFYTVVVESSAPFHEALKDVLGAVQPSIEKVRAMIRIFLDFYVQNADLWRVLMHESGFTDVQREKYREEFRIPISMLETALAEGVSQHVIKKCDVKRTAYGLFSVIIMMVFQNFVKEDIEETAEMIADIFFYGIAQE